MFVVKQASRDNVAVADQILDRIYNENPSYWPYGLSRAHFDGGLYLVTKTASEEPIGFVGWQERRDGLRKVGYYSVGILKEYRGEGKARQALVRLLQEKSASVDEVRALVMAHNEPSKALAKSLPGVTLVEKKASSSKGPAKLLGWLVGGALAGGPGLDYAYHGEGKPFLDSLREGWNDPARRHDMNVNMALGALSGAVASRSGVVDAAKVGLMIPGKDLIIRGKSKLDQLSADKVNKALDAASTVPEVAKKMDPKLIAGISAGGLLGAGLIGSRVVKALRDRAEAARAGRIRVTLPTREEGDAETVIDMPMDEIELSRSLRGRLHRDTRRRLLEETRGRTRRVSPNKKNLTPAEKEIIDIQAEAEELDKKASVSAFRKLAGAVPTPPPLGTNPALRMTQERMVAEQAAQGASTEANPQIMQAQQAAAAAEQQAQAQMQQVQQAAQQELTQAQQAMQQEALRAEQERRKLLQENEMLKMQVEKNKIESELRQAQQEAKNQITKGEGQAVNTLVKQRLNRINKRLSKAASASSTLPPVTDLPPPSINSPLAPWAGQRLNTNSYELAARGRIMPIHLYRASYGKLGDAAYDFLARPLLTRPSYTQEMQATLPMDFYGRLQRMAMDEMHRPRIQ